ncbi:MAG: hypothetical protein EPN76_00375, partial [Burkholderiaceae bacterium]
GWDCPGSHNLNFSNRPVRTRMPGGVAGVQPIKAAPYADSVGGGLHTIVSERRFGSEKPC